MSVLPYSYKTIHVNQLFFIAHIRLMRITVNIETSMLATLAIQEMQVTKKSVSKKTFGSVSGAKAKDGK